MPSRKEILESNQYRIETAEERAARAVAGAYNRARGELVSSLITSWTGPENISPAQALDLMRQLSLIGQIDSRLKALEGEVGGVLRGIVNGVTELAVEQVGREIGLLPAEFRPDVTRFAMLDTALIERFVPVVMSDIQGITQTTIAQLQRELQTGLITGQSFPQLIRRLFNEQPSDGVSPWANGRRSAELMTRRTVITANNAAKQEALAKINERAEPKNRVQKQAVATVQSSTTETCLRVHGQIVDVDKPFKLEGEPRFAREMMAPAFHWRCRTSIAMYHPAFERGGLTTANMEASAKAELARRAAAKRPAPVAAPTPPAPKVPPAYDLGEGTRLRQELTRQDKALRTEYQALQDEYGDINQRVEDLYTDYRQKVAAEEDYDKQTDLLIWHMGELKKLQAARDAVVARQIGIQQKLKTLAQDTLAVPKAQQSKITTTWASTFKGKKGVGKLRERVKEAVDFVSAITADTPIDSAIELDTSGRAYATRGAIHISLPTTGRTIVHEIGHVIEETRGAAYRVKRLAFFDKRTAGDSLEKLVDLFPGWGYDDREVVKKDKWESPYMGKVYSFDSDTNSSSEVISMAIERLFNNAVAFAETDPEYFDFVVSYLRGTL